MGMAEYIEREALMRRIKEIHCAECDSYHGVKCRACWVDDTLDYIDCEPAADVAPVRRGRWLTWEEQFPGEKPRRSNNLGVFCDKCHNHADNRTDFCPNCGAKMKGES